MRKILILTTFVSFVSCGQKTTAEFRNALEVHRTEYKAEFEKDERAPLRTKEELALIDFYPADAKYSCECTVQLEEVKKPFDMSTYSGKTQQYLTYAKAKCDVNGKELTVALYQNVRFMSHPLYGKSLFLPFKDHTNGETTYGGGRYIDIKIDSIKNGKLNIDFNHCYNPWCAYSDGYNCPVPPVENHFDMAIEAGEKLYKGEQKH